MSKRQKVTAVKLESMPEEALAVFTIPITNVSLNNSNENNENNLLKLPNDLDKVTSLEWSFRKILPLRSRLWTKQYFGKFWVLLLVSCGRYRTE